MSIALWAIKFCDCLKIAKHEPANLPPWARNWPPPHARRASGGREAAKASVTIFLLISFPLIISKLHSNGQKEKDYFQSLFIHLNRYNALRRNKPMTKNLLQLLVILS